MRFMLIIAGLLAWAVPAAAHPETHPEAKRLFTPLPLQNADEHSALRASELEYQRVIASINATGARISSLRAQKHGLILKLNKAEALLTDPGADPQKARAVVRHNAEQLRHVLMQMDDLIQKNGRRQRRAAVLQWKMWLIRLQLGIIQAAGGYEI